MFDTHINEILHTIFNAGQGGFILERYIGENIIEIPSVIDKLEIEDNQAY